MLRRARRRGRGAALAPATSSSDATCWSSDCSPSGTRGRRLLSEREDRDEGRSLPRVRSAPTSCATRTSRIRSRARARSVIEMRGLRGQPLRRRPARRRSRAGRCRCRTSSAWSSPAMVDAVGPGVEHFASGDRVWPQHEIECGECRYCRAGKPNLCRNAQMFSVQLPRRLRRVGRRPRARDAPPARRPELRAGRRRPGRLHHRMAHARHPRPGCEPGQTVVVQAAGSGIGHAAIQIAALAGARVIATAGADRQARARAASWAPTRRSTTARSRSPSGSWR